MNIKPLGDRVIIEVLESDEKTKSGLYLPDTAKEKPQEGKVMAVGPGRSLESGKVIPPQVKAGDRVIFGKYTGDEIKVGDKEYLIIRESDILGVVKSA
ncbi:MAG: co-chaperone GroES [Candidatus Omnitrophica bacterium]|nr:co-chaperone GroES [Candidatus Omnitrophota bacterium]